MSEYIPQSTHPHGRDEELQWARILRSGEVVNGMVVIYLQKMCAAFHEFEPAYRAGGLNENFLPFFKERLSRRIQAVLSVLHSNGLDSLAGYSDLAYLKQLVGSATDLKDLADLAEPVHQANHTITDALEII